MLVSAQMRRPSASNFGERFVAACLRPSVAVQVGQETVFGVAVKVDGAAKSGLGENCFHRRARPILSPVAEEA